MLYFRVFSVGSTTCSGEVGIAFHQKWIENVSEVDGISDRIVVLKLAFEGNLLCAFFVYAPQSGLNVFMVTC